MPSFNILVPHQTDRQTAIQRLRRFADIVRTQMVGQVSDVQEQWSEDGTLDFSFAAMGMKITGAMNTDDQNVALKGTLPFAALPFRGMIEKTIQEKIQEALAE